MQTILLRVIPVVLLPAILIQGAHSAVIIEKTNYSHYGAVTKLSNGTIDVMVTTDVGPRVIFYGFSGGKNMLAELPQSEPNKTKWGDWHAYGGHRLWTAPEGMPRSYYPDNSPVKVTEVPNGATFTAPAEEPTSVQKKMTVTLALEGAGVKIDHEVTNIGEWPVEFAAWALTIVRGGGTTIFPQEPFKAHGEVLLPARPLTLWNYTDMSDPRWTFGKKLVQLRTDAGRDSAQKVGALVTAGWASYLLEGDLFVKRFPYIAGATYPDYGCNFETFTKGTFMEVETVGPITKLQPGESVTHDERWFLFKDVKPGAGEDALEAAVAPLVQSTGK